MEEFFEHRHFVMLPPRQDAALRAISSDLCTTLVAVAPRQLIDHCLHRSLPAAFNALSAPKATGRDEIIQAISRYKAMPKKAFRNVQVTAEQQKQLLPMAADLRCDVPQLLTYLIDTGLKEVQSELGKDKDRSKQAALRRKMGLKA